MIRAGDLAQIAALTVLFGISLWLVRSLEKQDGVETDPLAAVPDHIMENFNSSQFDRHGRLVSQLQAQRMRHYAGPRNTELEQPYLVWYEGAPVWFLRAERGELTPGGDTVYFLGESYFRRHHPSGSLEAEIFTRDVSFRPADGHAETAAAALIRTPRGDELRGTGLRAQTKDRRLELLADVESTYRGQR